MMLRLSDGLTQRLRVSLIVLSVFLCTPGVRAGRTLLAGPTTPQLHVIADASQNNPLLAMSQKRCLPTPIGNAANAFKSVLKGHGLLCQIDTIRLLKGCQRLEGIMKEIGQTQSARLIGSNIQKIEKAYKDIPPRRRGTVIEILEYEKELGIHGKDGMLADPSAAVGLLWIRRSLAFQYSMYDLLLRHPRMSGVDVALKAYAQELEPYHGNNLRRLYRIALKASTPCRSELLCKLGGFDSNTFGPIQEAAVIHDMHGLLRIWKPILTRWRNNHVRLGLEDMRRA